MGFADRDYYRQPPRPAGAFGGSFSMMSITTWLIIINVAVFVIDRLSWQRIDPDDPYSAFYSPIQYWWEFRAPAAIGHLQLWRFITFQFLHAGPEHLLFNMIALFFFGPMIERYLGRITYLIFYLLCGIAGPISLLILEALHFRNYTRSALVGASAGIFGVLIAAAQVAPDTTVLIYGMVPARLRTVAWVLLAVAVYTVFSNGHNAGGEAAHLGGAAAGYLLIRYPIVLKTVERSTNRLAARLR